MILTICFDPVLEKSYYVDNLFPGKESIASKKIYDIRGKGIINGLILRHLNVDVFTTGFVGGLQGQYISNILKEKRVYIEFIPIRDESRSRLLIYQDEELLTMIGEEGPRITRDEIGSFYKFYSTILDRFDIICGLGNPPTNVGDDIYYDLIKVTNKHRKKFILDAEGEELRQGLAARPFMVRLNKKDLEELSNLVLDFENEIIKVARSIVEEGVELVAVDLGDQGSIFLTQDGGYRLELTNTSIPMLGEDQGYLAAGFAFGLYKSYDLETIMRLAQAFRIAYAMGNDLEQIEMSDIKKFMTKIEIFRIYY